MAKDPQTDTPADIVIAMVAMWLLTYMLIVGDKETGGQRDGETERRTDSEDLQRQIDRKHDTLCNILKANSSPSFHVKLVLRLGPCVLLLSLRAGVVVGSLSIISPQPQLPSCSWTCSVL